MMDQLIAEFPAQLVEALAIGRDAKLTQPTQTIHNILVAGLGGSGIGANFCIEFTSQECTVPYAVTKGYALPAYVNENTLVICSSYSGNTEETLYSLEDALAKKAKVVIVTSGGKLLAKAKELGLDYIAIPANKPSPRACLGYSFVQQLFILKFFGFISDRSIQDVDKAVALLNAEQTDIMHRARIVANGIFNKIPVIYTTDRMEAVAVRFRQQLCENSKILCWHHVVPEMCHNELVGWRQQEGKFAVLMFRNDNDFQRNAVRMDILKDVVKDYADTTIEIWSHGTTDVERAMYFVHFGDWVSFYLAELRQMDAVEVKVIDFLKSELAKV